MRKITPLTQARFNKQGEAPAAVTLPHTWNAFDGQDGGADYWRGLGMYELALPAPSRASGSISNSAAQTMWRRFTAMAVSLVRTRAAFRPSDMN